MGYKRCQKCQETMGECRCPDPSAKKVSTAEDWLRFQKSRKMDQEILDQAEASKIVTTFLNRLHGGADIWQENEFVVAGESRTIRSLAIAKLDLFQRGFVSDFVLNNFSIYELRVQRPKEED